MTTTPCTAESIASVPPEVVRLAEVGPFLGGRPLARALREHVESAARRSGVVVDLTGVQAMSPSFADELFAKIEPALWHTHRVELVHADLHLQPMVEQMVARRTNQAH